MPKLEAAGKILKEANAAVVDGSKIGFDKLLSKGELKQKIIVRNMKASKKAIEKVKKAGGDIELKENEMFEKDTEKPEENETLKKETEEFEKAPATEEFAGEKKETKKE